jgi:hypothetical protein
MCKSCKTTSGNFAILINTTLKLIKYEEGVIPQEPDKVRLELMRHVLVMADDDKFSVEQTGALLNFMGQAYNAAGELLDSHQGSLSGAISQLDAQIEQDMPMPGHGIPDMLILRGRRKREQEPSRITREEFMNTLFGKDK